MADTVALNNFDRGTSQDSSEPIELFVSGRVCLFGEHSDWAGGYRKQNPSLAPGATIVCGTATEGLHARVRRLSAPVLQLRSCLDDGTVHGAVEFPLDARQLAQVAQAGGFWSYACGVASYMVEKHGAAVGGLRVDNASTTLPVKKGLSSSAALCVLVARAFSRAYNLNLSVRDEMEAAYQGEILTPSQCGRMDQACAYGPRPVVLHFDGDSVKVEECQVGAPVHLVIADLHASKDTVVILRSLRAAYPEATTPIYEGVQRLLGPINQGIIATALSCLEKGDAAGLGGLMREAQSVFDDLAGAACPDQLSAPVLHKVLDLDELAPFIYGGKGVGSQGDGSVQFVCKDEAAQSRVAEILQDAHKLHVLKLTIPATHPSTSTSTSTSTPTSTTSNLANPSAASITADAASVVANGQNIALC